MTKSNVLFSALVALVALVSTTSAFADDNALQCGMLASAGQPLPPFCAKQAPTTQQATAPVAKKKTTPVSTESTKAPAHSIEVTVTLEEDGSPKKVGYAAAPVKVAPAKQHKPTGRLATAMLTK